MIEGNSGKARVNKSRSSLLHLANKKTVFGYFFEEINSYCAILNIMIIKVKFQLKRIIHYQYKRFNLYLLEIVCSLSKRSILSI